MEGVSTSQLAAAVYENLETFRVPAQVIKYIKVLPNKEIQGKRCAAPLGVRTPFVRQAAEARERRQV